MYLLPQAKNYGTLRGWSFRGFFLAVNKLITDET